MEAKISVIVPICNVREYLKQCLDSLISQSLQEIEIICADDYSDDGSRELLLQYAAADPRIVPLLHEKNMGTSQTRKDAVLISRGQYVMFVDGDDFLMPDACERAYQAITESATDMVQFGVNIINCAGVSKERIAMNQRIVNPCTELIEDADLLRLCWEEKKFRFLLWNKIYRGDICRKAFAQIEDGAFPKAQDLYAFFVIAFFSKSTAGITDKLYNYNFGIGVTGGNQIGIQQFERLLTEYNVYGALCRFLKSYGKEETYGTVLSNIYESFLGECVNKWKNSLRPEYVSEGFEKLADVWGFKNVVCSLAKGNWYNRRLLMEKVIDVDYFSYKKGNGIKTIALYYRNIKNGGAQRVVATLCNLWSAMKTPEGEKLYDVILITDEEALEDEYYLDERVIREFLPANDVYIKEKYMERFAGWERILSKHKIDIVVTGMWVGRSTFWDMLSVKGHSSHPAFVVHAHNFCALPYQYENCQALEQNYLYQMCDGVVTLSECDLNYVSTFCSYSKYIINPVTFRTEASHTEAEKSEVSLLWVGRISKEKQPLDAIRMMEYIVSEMPDVKLYMVGGGSEKILEEMQTLIEQLQLQDNIVLPGFQTDVDIYYKNASVFITTSEYEGFSLTIGEALSYALPVVSYDMPWLTFMKDGRGIISVKQRRVDLLAQEVIRLLKNPEAGRQLGNSGRQQIVEMEQVDIGAEWKSFFDGIGEASSLCPARTCDNAILYKYLTLYQQMGKDKVISSKTSLNKQLQKANKENDRLKQKIQLYKRKTIRLRRKLKASQKELKAIKRSVSWRICTKMRDIWHGINKIFGCKKIE